MKYILVILVIKIIRGVKGINHSQLVDDTILLGGASTIIVVQFKKILDSFLSSLGGKVNKQKCQIFGWNAIYQLLQRISKILQFPFQEKWSSFKYVGMSLYLSNSSAQSQQSILDEIKCKFYQLGSQWLNIDMCVIIIKLILISLLIF